MVDDDDDDDDDDDMKEKCTNPLKPDACVDDCEASSCPGRGASILPTSSVEAVPLRPHTLALETRKPNPALQQGNA